MNRERIQKINDMMKKIKGKEILKDIFFTVQSELNSSGECKYSHNNNGIFFDLTILSISTLEKIEEILRNNLTQTHTDSDITHI